MRDRLTEFLPLLLVGVILLVFQFTRSDGPGLPVLRLASPTPTPALASSPPQRVRDPVAVAGATAVSLGCQPNLPRFVGSMATLRAALGASMGDPLECERSVDTQGNTQQRTTTGLAYRRKDPKATCFTTGWDHWAQRDDGTVVYWAGDAIDPPIDAVVVTSR